MYQSLFLLKLQAEACDFIKKDTLATMFSCEFCEIFQNTFITEHLWTTLSRFRIFLLHPFSFTYYIAVYKPEFVLIFRSLMRNVYSPNFQFTRKE